MDWDSVLTCFNTIIDLASGLVWLVGIVATLVIIIIVVARIRWKATNFSKKQIEILKAQKKYIPGVFVELNNTKEIIRFFVYGKKWKHRIIRKYNQIYDNYYGNLLKKGLIVGNLKTHLLRFCSLKKIEQAVNQASEIHERIDSRQMKYSNEFGDTKYVYEISNYSYIEFLKEIDLLTKAIEARYLILTGSAGNGKTNMLCSVSELLIRLKEGVVFLNARELDGDICQYIMRALEVGKWWEKHKNTYFVIANSLLKLRRKKLFVIIDAINENDKNDFTDRLSAFINSFSKYSRVKVIVSCRNEYYNERFRKKLVDGVRIAPFECDLKDTPFSMNARERIITRYKEHFGFGGEISPVVCDILCEHLLLVHIFFEVYQNKRIDINSIQKHEVFRAYIGHLSNSGIPAINDIIGIIIGQMLNSNSFDSVSLNVVEKELNRINVNYDELEAALDGNALIGKRYVYHPNTIGQTDEERVYFVFDELRDYCIAQEIVSNHTFRDEIDEDGILSDLDGIKKRQLSCDEGVTHYIYVFFRTCDILEEKSAELCSRILDYYRIVDESPNRFYHGRRHREEFMNLGLKIIFTTGLEIQDYELDYTRDCLTKNSYEDGGRLFDFLLEGTKKGSLLNLDLYLEILFGLSDLETLRESLSRIICHGTFLLYEFPMDLVKIHKKMIEEDSDGAIQIQRVAELFLLFFKLNDEEEQKMLVDYFFELELHVDVQRELENRIQECFEVSE